MEAKLYILFVTLLSVSSVNSVFNCGRAMDSYQCQNGGTCDRDTGNCACKTEFTGDDCSVPTASVCAEGTNNPCQNGGICHGEGLCNCNHTYYGPTCEEERVQALCKGAQFTMTVAVPTDFIGKIFLATSEECEFKEIAESHGLKRFEYQMKLNETNACNNALNISENGNDIIYSTQALVTYTPPIISPSDLTLNIRCVHRASDVEMGSLLGAVNLDKEKNLDNQEKEKVYAPVEFRFLSEKNEKVQQLSVGEKFKLLFFLDDDSVYTSLLLMNCSANNTNPENPKVYKILEDACPTRAGKNVIYYDYGQSQSKFTSEKGTEHNAAEIMLKAFKFVDSDRVAFSCGVRICKRGDEALCEIPDCAAGEKPAAPKKTDPAAATDPAGAADPAGEVAQPAENTAPAEAPAGDAGTAPDSGAAADIQPVNDATAPDAAPVDTSAGVPADQSAPDAGTVAKRKKRSASSSNTEERTISGIIEIIDPIQREPSRDNQEKQEGDCFRSRDIIIVIIVMAAFVLTLLIACIVLAITVTKTRSRVNNMISESNGHSFFIPRAKITA